MPQLVYSKFAVNRQGLLNSSDPHTLTNSKPVCTNIPCLGAKLTEQGSLAKGSSASSAVCSCLRSEGKTQEHLIQYNTCTHATIHAHTHATIRGTKQKNTKHESHYGSPSKLVSICNDNSINIRKSLPQKMPIFGVSECTNDFLVQKMTF